MLPLILVPILLSRLDSPVTDRAEALAKQALKYGAEPRGASPLIRLHALLDEVDDLNLLVDPLVSLTARRGTDGNVRVLAKQFLADVERARGRTVRAQGLLDELGFVQDWYVVGSFDNEGKGGCDTDFGPETALDLRATYPAKGREVGWRKPGARAADGSVDLSVTLRPNTEAVAYALTFLKADVELRAVLSFGAPGGYRLFVNGVKVSSGDRYNQPRADQQRLQVTLRKGVNRVLLKVCQQAGPLGFFFRAEKAEGAKGTLGVTLPEAVPPLERGAFPAPQPLPTLTEALAARVKAAPNDAELRGDYATALAWTHAWDDKEHLPALEAEKAADARPDDVPLQVLAAGLQQEDSNHRRHYLERAFALAPRDPWVRLQLAQLELAKEHPAQALALISPVLQQAPDFAPAWPVRIRALEALGERVASSRAAEDAFRRLPTVPPVAREAVAAARRGDRLAEAVERARMALSLRFDDLPTRRVLASMLADMGRIDDAAEQYRKVLALDPFDLGSQLRLAELLSANGHLDDSREVFEQARRMAQDDPDVYEREGRALLHAGQKDGALASFTTSLGLRPQNPALKELVRTLRGDDAGGSTPNALAAASLLDSVKGVTGEDAVYLADVTSVRVQTSGLSSRFTQVVVKVLTDRGVESFRQLPINWSPDRQEVRVLKARISKPDGSAVDSFSDQDHNINEPWTGMYYDARVRVLTFPALAPGDVLEVQYRVDDTAVDNLLSDYWGDVDAVQSVFPKKRYLYAVDMPKERPLYWNKSALPAWVAVTQQPQGDRVLYRFEAAEVAKIVPEPQMPGYAEVSTPLHVSTYKTWEDVGQFYWGLVRDQLTPNDELKKTVEKALAGVDKRDEAKVVAAIYDFVVTNTRYVALEFGIHGYKPYPVSRVLARRFGDCKDKASLIVAMLKVAGVDSRLVLLRMRHLGALSGEPASLSAFNHAIAYVPSLGLFLDGTAEFHGSRELPNADRVANVLIVEPTGPSRFLTTPEAEPRENLTTLAMEVQLKAEGAVTASGSITSLGQSAPEMRRTYETVATRTATFEQQWGSSFPGMTASEVTVSDPKALEQPAVLGFKVLIPRYAEAAPAMLRFYPFGASRAFTQALAPLAERKWDVVLPGTWTNRFSMTYTPPPGWAAGEIPAEVVEDSPFGSLRITVRAADGKLYAEGEMTLARARIGAKEYPAFREWLLRVDQAFSRKLTVVKAGGQTASR